MWQILHGHMIFILNNRINIRAIFRKTMPMTKSGLLGAAKLQS